MPKPSFSLTIIIIGWLVVLGGVAFLCWLAAFVMSVLIKYAGIA